MAGQLFTIGHSNHTSDEFLDLLKKHDVGWVIDVRSMPFSRYVPQFNRDQLKTFLAENGIKYFHMGKHFGARRTESNLYSKEGYVDFEKVRASEIFRLGLESIIRGLNEGNRITLMCAEKCPVDCHRGIMVARGFELNGVSVQHILSDGSIETQEELDSELLYRFFPERDQISMDELLGESRSDEELLEEAYRLRNKEVGYRHNSDREDE